MYNTNNNRIEIEASAVNSNRYYRNIRMIVTDLIIREKYYLVYADISTTEGDGNARIAVWDSLNSHPESARVSNPNNHRVGFKFKGDVFDPNQDKLLSLLVEGEPDSGGAFKGYFDNVGIQIITKSEYDSTDVELLLDKYTYNEGKQDSEKVKVKVVGTNIFNIEKPYSDPGTSYVEIEQNSISLNVPGKFYPVKYRHKLKPNTTYRLQFDNTSTEVNGRCDIWTFDMNKWLSSTELNDFVVVTTDKTGELELHFYNAYAGANNITFSNIMLTEGANAHLDYVPYKESLSVINTKLSSSDTLFTRNGVVYKNDINTPIVGVAPPKSFEV